MGSDSASRVSSRKMLVTDVRPAVVVEIAETDAPLHGRERGLRQPGSGGDVGKNGPVIAIQADRLAAIAGRHQVEPAVAIEVAEVRGHVAEDFPVRAEGRARENAILGKGADRK